MTSENGKTLTTIIIGTNIVDWRTMEIDTPPFPEHDSGFYLEIGGEGIVLSGEKNSDGSRFQSGVIEAHHSTTDWTLILNTYKKWLEQKNKPIAYIFVLYNGELVHHEAYLSNLL